MIPIYLYIENFFSHEKSEIDFTSFSSALIVGKVDNNDLISNGVGKTSIFKSIEYCLFNAVRDPLLQKDIVLEKLIRDEADKVLVIFDFSLDGEIYRVSRARTRKGISDLSFYRRNAVLSSDPVHTPETDKKLWDNLSGRRAMDTEADLNKKIKSNYKSFLATNHFLQGDLSGLAMATPEKRKSILKEVLDLMIYPKLEEMAKEKAANLLKEIEKNKAVISSLGNPQIEIDRITKELGQTLNQQKGTSAQLLQQKSDHDRLNEHYAAIFSRLNVLEAQSSAVLSKHQGLKADVGKLEASVNDTTSRRKATILTAKQANEEKTKLSKQRAEVIEPKTEEVQTRQKELEDLQRNLEGVRIRRGIVDNELKGLIIPLPADGATCPHCRQEITKEHRELCEGLRQEQLRQTRDEAKHLLDETGSIEKGIAKQIQAINLLAQNKKLAENLDRDLLSKDKEMQENKRRYEEYDALLKQSALDLAQKKTELLSVEAEVQSSSSAEMNDLRQQLSSLKLQSAQAALDISTINQTLSNLQSNIAVAQHSIEQKQLDIVRKIELADIIQAAEDEYTVYPSVIQAFGSSGIPNLLIQNVLEDLQAEANNLLAQIRPGLQLAFSIEKTKGDGAVVETLEISYLLNNKVRDYSQLSGAQRLCIAFSMKLGLSFLLAKMMGSQIKFLLLDEVDQSLDKAGVDAFADIIKLFQSSFKILVISHNDRLKERFKDIIVVEQDQNMVSHAKLLTA